MGAFILLAAIEASFLLALAYDVQIADKSAAREFELLQASAQFSRVMLKVQECFDSADELRKDILDRDKTLLYKKNVRVTMKMLEKAMSQLSKCGLDARGARSMESNFAGLMDLLDTVLANARARGDSKTSFRQVLNQSGDLYRNLLVELRNVKTALTRKSNKKNIANLDPQYLIYIAAAVNLAAVAFLLIAADRGITGPIQKLSTDCQKVMKAETLSKPAKITNEISSLELSFYEMSLVVAENEKRRRNFLEFFQSVQSAALENVRKCFDALLAESNLQERARKNIQKARSNLQTLISLLQSMTAALSFKTQDTLEVNYQADSSSKLLQNAQSAVEALLQKRKISLNLQGASYECMLDSTLISRVLINFLSNAIKYSPEGSEVLLRVDKIKKNSKSMLEFRVSDCGPGISKENQERLFKEFSQVDSADGVKRAGTGLGLVICKQIVEAHQGEVGVESAVGKGSSFWFSIPCAPDETRQEEKAKSGKEQRGSPEKSSSRTSKSSSLKNSFYLLLAVLLASQSLLAFRLNSIFAATAKTEQSFLLEKEVILRVEELMATHLVWKLDVAKSLDKTRIDEVAATQPVLQQQIDNCSWILANIGKKSKKSIYEINRARLIFEKLKKFGAYLSAKQDSIPLAALPPLVKQAKVLAGEVETSLFRVLSIGESSVLKSYDGSKILRAELMNTLVIASVLNFFLLALLSIFGLRISEQISLLKQKSEDFASGKDIEPSIRGNDELAILDRSLCDLARAIKEADSQRQKLIALINHDLRTPLSSIINGLQLILEAGYGGLGAGQKVLTEKAETELQHLLQQINDLLLIEKIDAGLYQLSAEKLAVLPILEEAARSYGELAAKKGVRLVPEFPSEIKELCVNAEKSLLAREFEIIIENALDASPDGSTVNLSIELLGKEISVVFKDHGNGINTELLPQIFERFRFVGGKPLTGLGLPLAKRLSTIHGGSLQINSNESGTETRLLLPVA